MTQYFEPNEKVIAIGMPGNENNHLTIGSIYTIDPNHIYDSTFTRVLEVPSIDFYTRRFKRFPQILLNKSINTDQILTITNITEI